MAFDDAEIKGRPLGQNKLLRILGVTFGLAVAIGGTIGIGILRMPGVVAAQLETSGLIIMVWTAVGLYAFVGANSYAELGTMLPLTGGPYVYARRTYGDFGGFLVGWSDWLERTCSIAYLAMALSEYSATLLAFPASLVTPIAITVLILFTALHWLGLRIGSRTQEIMSLFKVLVFFVIIASCFLFHHRAELASAPPPQTHLGNPILLFVAIGLALQNVVGTYSGWNCPVYFAEENTNPTKTIPRSLFTGVALVMAIYVLFNLAMLHALPVSQLAGSRLAAADAAQAIFGGHSSQFISLVALISLLGIINASFLLTPRILFALSRDGLIASSCARVNTGGTPTVALFVTSASAILLAAVGTFEKLFALTAFLYVLIEAAIYATLFVLRRKEPDLPRPFRAWGYPFLPALALAGAILLLISFIISNTLNSLYALIGMATSYPLYLFAKRRLQNHTPKHLL